MKIEILTDHASAGYTGSHYGIPVVLIDGKLTNVTQEIFEIVKAALYSWSAQNPEIEEIKTHD